MVDTTKFQVWINGVPVSGYSLNKPIRAKRVDEATIPLKDGTKLVGHFDFESRVFTAKAPQHDVFITCEIL